MVSKMDSFTECQLILSQGLDTIIAEDVQGSVYQS